jgi:hypothetical protein
MNKVYKVNPLDVSLKEYNGRLSNDGKALVYYNEYGTKIVVPCSCWWHTSKSEAKQYIAHRLILRLRDIEQAQRQVTDRLQELLRE